MFGRKEKYGRKYDTPILLIYFKEYGCESRSKEK